jgi:hypothetical protein
MSVTNFGENTNNRNAFVVANSGLGDTIVLSGMVNFLATKYKIVYVACIAEFYEQIKLFYSNKNIIPYPVDVFYKSNIHEFSKLIFYFRVIYDIYYVGNYGAVETDIVKYTKLLHDGTTKKIITNYPVSYYDDVDIPIEYMTKYFSVCYPEDVLEKYEELNNNYTKYRVIHQIGSNASVDVIKQSKLDIDDMLTIDINKNLYCANHAYYNICEKFVNLKSVIFYAKLLENASELYLIDSCIHALALIVDISKENHDLCTVFQTNLNIFS